MPLGTDTTITVGLLVVLVGVASSIGVGLFRIARAERETENLREDLVDTGSALRAELHSLENRVTAAETRIHGHGNALVKLESSLESGLDRIRDELRAMREELLQAIKERGGT